MGLGGFGMGEMIFIFLIVLLLFGAKRLPEIGSSLGKGIREFKSSVKDIERELTVPEKERQIHRTHQPPPAAPKDQPSDESEGEPRKLSDGVPSSSASE
ncbi:MAG TPA: twin-arginine translocase TatA/TatE family subunit [Longimicrobiales bacterium]|nr:twin-arginine translocase TatA/TatE family subunit [Longimicrobiales bacterium]